MTIKIDASKNKTFKLREEGFFLYFWGHPYYSVFAHGILKEDIFFPQADMKTSSWST